MLTSANASSTTLNNNNPHSTLPSITVRVVNAHHSFDTYFYIQENFCLSVCQEIFGELSDHIYRKFINVEENVIRFIARLDFENREKLFTWAENAIVEERKNTYPMREEFSSLRDLLNYSPADY